MYTLVWSDGDDAEERGDFRELILLVSLNLNNENITKDYKNKSMKNKAPANITNIIDFTSR